MDFVLTSIGKEFISKTNGFKTVRCSVKCISENEYKNQSFSMYIVTDKLFDYKSPDGRVRENIAHYIIKHNLKIGVIYRGLFLRSTKPQTGKDKLKK